MRSSSRAARRLGLLLPLLLFSAAPMPLQAAGENAVPWLYRGSDVPVDKEWRFGTLPNGLRYAVRKNGVPPDQVSIRIRIDAGSLHEAESERGFAHLIEHLSFRESRYLREGEAIPVWQRLGATFGSDTNAETTPTQTVYKLDLPNATPANLDETFKLLSGMMTAPVFTAHGVKTEVPIVLAEMREHGGAGQRVSDATRSLYFTGQRLADRSPIGREQTLLAATDTSVRSFHQRWYRPENTVVVVAGDADPAELERLVTKWFGEWKVKGKPTPAPQFGVPTAPKGADPANPVGEAKVLVEPDLPRMINYAILRPWKPVNDTIEYNRGLMLDQMAQALINRRLEARARAGGSYLIAQVNQEDVNRSADATFVSVTPLGDDWRAALKDVRAVIADALATPPSQAEIDRELAEFDVAFAVPVETRDTIAGSKLADDIVRAVEIHSDGGDRAYPRAVRRHGDAPDPDHADRR
jgi:zinc protease